MPDDGGSGIVWTEAQREAVFRDFPANIIPDQAPPLHAATYRSCKLFDSAPPPPDESPVYRSIGAVSAPAHTLGVNRGMQGFVAGGEVLKSGKIDREEDDSAMEYDDMSVCTMRQAPLTFGPHSGLNYPSALQSSSIAKKYSLSSTSTENDGVKKMPPYLTDCPYFLQPYTHCYFKGDSAMLQKLTPQITSVLEEKDVDTEYDAQMFKWIGRAYAYNRSLDMRVRIFTLQKDLESGDNFVLEFQRLQGCAMQFAYLYQCCLARLSENDDIGVSFRDEAGNSKDFKEPEHDGTPKVIDMGYSETLDLEAFNPLVSMTMSEFVDIKRQAVREIANQLAKKTPRGLLVQSKELGDELIRLVMSKDREQLRCALAGIANILDHPADAAEFKKTCGGLSKETFTAVLQIAKGLDQDGSNQHMEVELETRRHCASSRRTSRNPHRHSWLSVG